VKIAITIEISQEYWETPGCAARVDSALGTLQLQVWRVTPEGCEPKFEITKTEETANV
jgi:hypothetical protein